MRNLQARALSALLSRIVSAVAAVLLALGLCQPIFGQTDNVAIQIGNLTNADPAIRKNAAEVLGRFEDPRAVEPLLSALHDSDPKVRAAGTYALKRLNDKRAVGPLIPLLNDTDPNVRSAAAFTLGALKDSRAIPQLIVALKDGGVTRIALQELGLPAIGPLIIALKDPDPIIRANAAEALWGSKDPRVVPALLDAIKDREPKVRNAICGALSMTSDSRAVDPLIAALKDTDLETRLIAARTIDRTKDARAVEPLIALLGDSNKELRVAAVYSLKSLGGPAAIDALVRLAHDPDETMRWNAVNALSEIKDHKIAVSLIQIFEDKTQSALVRETAARGMGNQQEPRVADPLITALDDPDFGIRMSAADALGHLKEPRAVQPLIEATKRPADKWNNSVYYHALGQIGEPAVLPLIAMASVSGDCNPLDALAVTHDLRSMDLLLRLIDTPYTGPQVPPYGGSISIVSTAKSAQDEKKSVCYRSVLNALSKTGDPRAIAPLIEYMKNGPYGRDSVPYLFIPLGSKAADPLISVLHDANERTRSLAAQSLFDIDDSAGNRALISALSERNLSVLAGAPDFYISLGQSGSEDVLIEALDRRGGHGMAESFLNCGNFKLEVAARAWAAEHEPTMTQQTYGLTWGKPIVRLKRHAT